MDGSFNFRFCIPVTRWGSNPEPAHQADCDPPSHSPSLAPPLPLPLLRCMFVCEQVHGEIITAVRDWQGWLLPLNRTLYNAFANRRGEEAPHSFSFKSGSRLSGADRRWLHSTYVGASDVYCCVKEFMGSPGLLHAPVLVLPHSRTTSDPLPTAVVPRIPLSKEKITSYTKLAKKCVEYDLPEAAQCLEDLMFNCQYTVPALQWLTHRWAEPSGQVASDSGNYFYPHLPSSFKLLAKDRY